MYAEKKQVNVAGISGLFEQAISNRLKYPKIRLQAGSVPVVLHRAGDKSKYNGQVMVTNGAGFNDPSNRFFGRIDTLGTFHTTDSATPDVLSIVEKLAENPVETAKDYGKLTGHCCFCDSPLKDARSTANGYGPVCAKHFNLPWDI